MKSLTIILLSNNSNNISTLKSIEQIDYDLEIIKKENPYNLHNDLNSIKTNDWILFLQENEIIENYAKITWVLNNKPNVYNLMILNNNIISKETRLWHKSFNLKFINPIYPFVESNKNELLDCVIKNGNFDYYKEEHIKQWIKDSPTLCKPYYYSAYWYLKNKQYSNFLINANNYLLRNNDNIPSTLMIKYHSAMINLYYKNFKEALNHILGCLASAPLMAEFWCSLGDIHYIMQHYNVAQTFYENAMILGSKRLFDDNYPIDINKYKTYPESMISQCNKIKQSSKFYKI